jgi:tRNA (guanine-N7-)-methyltransferase
MPRPPQPDALRTYGRRKGHRLSARKQALLDTLLPRLRLGLDTAPPADLATVFDVPVTAVALEIGFGAGEHLAWQAAHHPDCGFIGCEVYINGVAALLAHIEEASLDNIRIHDGDARALLAWLPDAAIARAYVLFPDPWPKKRHHKRRLISPETLAELARVMKPGAELRIASDIPDYVRTSLLAARQSGAFAWTAEGPSDWRQRPPDWPQTRYERKAVREGRRCSYLTFARR